MARPRGPSGPSGPSGPRMLKGLSLDNFVDLTEESIEDGADTPDEKPLVGRRSLRESNANAIYDMKYHPMDKVTRPNSAATHRHRSKSVSFAMDDDDDESSGLSSPPDSESDEEGSEEEEEDEDEDASPKNRYKVMLTPRTPDPRAVRHSSRSAARKPINYSKKYHPQDYGLPGYRNRALKHVVHPQVVVPNPMKKEKKKKCKHLLPTPEDDGQVDLVGAYDEHHEAVEQEERRPRKKLRSLNPNVVSSPRSQQVTPNASKESSVVLLDSDDELEVLVNGAIEASQLPPRPTQASSSDGLKGIIGMAIDMTQEPRESPMSSSNDREKIIDAAVKRSMPLPQAKSAQPSEVSEPANYEPKRPEPPCSGQDHLSRTDQHLDVDTSTTDRRELDDDHISSERPHNHEEEEEEEEKAPVGNDEHHPQEQSEDNEEAENQSHGNLAKQQLPESDSDAVMGQKEEGGDPSQQSGFSATRENTHENGKDVVQQPGGPSQRPGTCPAHGLPRPEQGQVVHVDQQDDMDPSIIEGAQQQANPDVLQRTYEDSPPVYHQSQDLPNSYQHPRDNEEGQQEPASDADKQRAEDDHLAEPQLLGSKSASTVTEQSDDSPDPSQQLQFSPSRDDPIEDCPGFAQQPEHVVDEEEHRDSHFEEEFAGIINSREGTESSELQIPADVLDYYSRSDYDDYDEFLGTDSIESERS